MKAESQPRAPVAAPVQDVAIVIVNYRVPALTIDCLASVEPEVRAHGRCRAIVVDNCSGDDSSSRISAAIAERGWSGWVEFVASPTNGGFAAGNNIGLRLLLEPRTGAAPELILLLNPDTIVRPGAVRELVEFLGRHPKAGIVGSRLEEEDGTQHDSRYRFPTIFSEFESHLRLGLVSRLLDRFVVAVPLVLEEHPIDWVAGASMMVRREVFEQIGLLDEGYFLYYEETDFCFRAKHAGWECWYAPRSRVAHLVGKSSGVTRGERRAARRPAYWYESRRRYFRKNRGACYAVCVDLAAISGLVGWKIRNFFQRKDDPDPRGYLFDLIRHCVGRRGAKT